jgi:hypothetical protein
MRRISFETHGVADASYTDDAFDDPSVLEKEFSADNLTHLVRLVDEIEASTDLELQLNYPELLNGASSLSMRDCITLHRKWAREAANILFNRPVPMMVR